VQVLFGSAVGLTAVGNQRWHQGTPGILGGNQERDQFGSSLAGADFDGDGFDDLAVGVPWEGFRGNGNNATGVVNVLFGSDAGLTAEGNQRWHQDIPGILGGNEGGDWFGSSLAGADFDGDGFDDLAIGVLGEGLRGKPDVGVVHVLFGSAVGLTAEGNQRWHQGTPGILGGNEPYDRFGSSLAGADFDGDGFDDLAIGVPEEDLGPKLEPGESWGIGSDAGVVNVLFGSDAGLTAEGNQRWHQDTPGIRGGNERLDRFGTSVAGADFDGDGFDDLTVGAPGDSIDGTLGAGAVNVLFGSDVGLTAAGNQRWHQDTADITGGVERNRFFGGALINNSRMGWQLRW
jgi:hypothetical protein